MHCGNPQSTITHTIPWIMCELYIVWAHGCKGHLSPTDTNYFRYQRTGKQNRKKGSERVNQTHLLMSAFSPEEIHFHPLSGQWEQQILSVRTVPSNSDSADIIKSQSDPENSIKLQIETAAKRNNNFIKTSKTPVSWKKFYALFQQHSASGFKRKPSCNKHVT